MSLQDPSSDITVAASRWLARRDRGLSPAEQDAYLQWLRESPAHAAEVARLERVWSCLNNLSQWDPTHSPDPNPDLLAPVRRRRWAWRAMAAAGVLLLAGAAVWWGSPFAAPRVPDSWVRSGPQQLALPDGSWIELDRDGVVEVAFSADERRVRLVRGRAHFTVARDALKPFVVVADTLAVRAVGTAFAMNLGDDSLSVLVTEGRVKVEELATTEAAPGRELSHVGQGEMAIVRTQASAPGLDLRVQALAAPEFERAIAWQSLRLDIVDLPLREVVSRFNRYNRRQLVIGDRATGDIVVGGSFRPDSVDAFVRLLEMGFNVTAEVRGDEIVLRRR